MERNREYWSGLPCGEDLIATLMPRCIAYLNRSENLLGICAADGDKLVLLIHVEVYSDNAGRCKHLVQSL
jgi:hypothetical protein